MPSVQNYLNLISQYESGNRNIVNYKFSPGFTAQGYYQITNKNWNDYAPLAGVDTSVYPTAMSAPQNVQAQVATYLLTQTPAGVSNWAAYNSQLASALSASGMQTSGQVLDASGLAPALPVSSGDPMIDLSGEAAQMPTPDILSQVDTTLGLSSMAPDTVLAIGLGAVVVAILAWG
jgi:hypothetical protein